MKSLRWVFILSAVIAVVSIGGAMISAASEVDWPRIGEMGASEMMETGVGPIAVMLVVMVVVLYMLYHFYRVMYPASIKNGVTAEAKVLKVWDTGTTINDNPQIGMLLEIKPQAGPAFQAEAKTLISRLNAALVQPGISATVVYDPENLKRVQIREVQVGNPASADSVARMEELEQLRSRSLITEQEYQEKRRQILSNL
jgi:hypothetical protein